MHWFQVYSPDDWPHLRSMLRPRGLQPTASLAPPSCPPTGPVSTLACKLELDISWHQEGRFLWDKLLGLLKNHKIMLTFFLTSFLPLKWEPDPCCLDALWSGRNWEGTLSLAAALVNNEPVLNLHLVIFNPPDRRIIEIQCKFSNQGARQRDSLNSRIDTETTTQQQFKI